MTSFKYACIIHHTFECVIRVANTHDCVVNDADIKACLSGYVMILLYVNLVAITIYGNRFFFLIIETLGGSMSSLAS